MAVVPLVVSVTLAPVISSFTCVAEVLVCIEPMRPLSHM
ncbi:MAG: hypothetical protein JCHSAcid_06650 [uncultured Acidilobus sp. JCHS]|nr:MAG: hypothetical protein JCHSAcid_06650 [uncultured Acidilobus sp. JCHS]